MEKRQKNGKSRSKGIPKIIDIPEQSRGIEDQDAEFFEGDDIGDYSFLQRLDEKELGKRVQKERLRPEERPAKIPTTVHEAGEEKYSDEGDMSDVLNEALASEEEANAIRKWDEEQVYEQKPRKGDANWQKKESKRLPLVTNGRVMNREASESESESDEETEGSDSSSDTDSDEEKPTEDVVPIKSGPEAVIEAKEALAKLAEEVIESPEEKVHCRRYDPNVDFQSQGFPRNFQQRQSHNQKARYGYSTYRLQRHYPWVINFRLRH